MEKFDERSTTHYLLSEAPDLAEPICFAVVCRGSIVDFDRLVRFLEESRVKIVYRKRSANYLWIVPADHMKGVAQ